MRGLPLWLVVLLAGCSLIVPGPDDFTYDLDDAGARVDAGDGDAGDVDAGDVDAGPLPDGGPDAGDGGPSCGPGEMLCGGGCVDTMVSTEHCGMCDDACDAGWQCRAGICYDTPVEVAVGTNHSCVRRASGSVWCWGWNETGQLGNGSFTGSPTPVRVSGITDATNVSGIGLGFGGFPGTNCVARRSGEVWCWGKNHVGQVGDGTMEPRNEPVRVPMVVGAIEAETGYFHSCAIVAGAPYVQCWGERIGRLGTYDLTPQAVLGAPSIAPYRALSVGIAHACFIDGASELWCWGLNGSGAVGDGTTDDTIVAREVVGLPPVVEVTTSAATCAREASGQVWCWGAESAIGTGGTTMAPVTMPQRLALNDAETLWGGSVTPETCARRATGALWCWGADLIESRRTGMTVMNPTPSPLGFWDGARSLALSYTHMCGVTAAGDVECVGYNGHGQLGDGSMTDSLVPVAVTLP